MDSHSIPHIERFGHGAHLIVDDKPFLILGAELHNSSLSSASYMQDIWPKLKADHVNTVLGPVTWQDIEAEEDQFDFSNLDQIVYAARSHGLKLILLWFASFKNGVSTYVPNWVKTNPQRFPRMLTRGSTGDLEVNDVLTVFESAAQAADAKAFCCLMQHIKEIDGDHSTVIMVQVENEIGLLGDSRDRSELAEAVFKDLVPEELIDFLLTDWTHLTEQLRSSLSAFKAGSLRAGSWSEVFGHSAATDELFMSYHYALYVEQVANRGSSAYNLPLFTNCWQSCNSRERDSDAAFPVKWVQTVTRPGTYPSGGPNINVLDIWQKFCPSLQFYAPDMYLNGYETSCEQFKHRGQPLMVVEQRRDPYGARRIWKGIGLYGMMGVSPFGIDTVEDQFGFNPYKEYYRLLSCVSSQILDAQKVSNIYGFYFDKPLTNFSPHDREEIKVRLGDYDFTIKRAFVFGQAGPGVGIIIALTPSQFLCLGWGYMAEFVHVDRSLTFSGILSIFEMLPCENGSLQKRRVLNGDEQRGGKWIVMPNKRMSWGDFPIAITIPGSTGIALVDLYSF